MEPPAGLEPSWQGYSIASWTIMGGQGNFERGGSLKVVTTHLKPGYYWKNGMPYTGNAVLTEYYRVHDLPDRSTWIDLSLMTEDPEYLTQPFIVTYHFKKLPDGSKWNPTPCSVK
jgi:ABC-type transport system substrate-binding protein